MPRAVLDPDTMILAVAKAINATFDRGKWLELALLTGTRDVVLAHPRLLRSLDWGDDDYYGHVISMVPLLLGDRATARSTVPIPTNSDTRFSNLKVVEEYLGLPEWLRRNEPALYARLYGGPVPMDDLQDAANQLGLSDVDEHAVRIRRALSVMMIRHKPSARPRSCWRPC